VEEIKSEKTIYIVEETEEYKKMKRIDELADGNQTSSTILQNKDVTNLQMQ
jgi:hypothetical protein